MADYFQVKNQNIFNPPANTSLGNATNQFNHVYVQTDLVLGNVTVTGTTIIAPRVTTITYPGDDTAVDTAGGQTITLTGSGFVAGASVLINGSAVSVVTVVSSTSITFTSPALSTGSYVLYVINPDGSTAISVPGIQYSGTPTWTTSAGSLGTVYETAIFSQTVAATGDAPITYSVVSGPLPTNITLNSSTGLISGTNALTASSTTYSFVIKAVDAQNQTTNRSFSITVNPDVVTWTSPADGSTITQNSSEVMIQGLSASSAAGKAIVYTADTLPVGLSIIGSNISGTPTVIANSSSTLLATANGSGRSSTRIINWNITEARSFDYLVVAGGGAGGTDGYPGRGAGGGGAGGFRTANSFAVTLGQILAVTVGAGGAENFAPGSSGSNGSNSVFASITSIGGGGGSSTRTVDGIPLLANSGGSGGGGGHDGEPAGSATAGQGNAGGLGGGNTQPCIYIGGGGGGAGGAGGAVGVRSLGGVGGIGLSSSITGTETYYAGGGSGGGGEWTPQPNGASVNGGLGGGGTGRTGNYNSNLSTAGTPNTGGGGGGAYQYGRGGGSGVVILRMPSNHSIASVGSGLTYTQSVVGAYRVYIFTAGAGTITV